MMGSAVVGDIIKRAIAAGIEWGKRRKKPPSKEIKQKVEEFVADATRTAPLPESLPAADQLRMISGIAELALPTFEEVVEYSPYTQRIVHAARAAVKKAPAKKGVAKKAAPKKALKSLPHKSVKKGSKRR
jgi:formate dehydrogenase maturation protein FdhE